MKEHKADYILLIYFVILLFFGLLMLVSASAPLGYCKHSDKYFYIEKQIFHGVLPGLVAFFLLSKLKYAYLKRYALSIFAFSLLLAVLVFVPGIGSDFGTKAMSWIKIGKISFQPAEFLKLGMIIFLAAFLAKKGKVLLNLKKGFLPVLAVGILPVIFVVLQPDIGTAVILFAILFGILFVAGARFWHLMALMGTGVAGLIVIISRKQYLWDRILAFFDPSIDQLKIGYHINQAFLAIGSGGWFGLGPGRSLRKYQFLPEVNADSIFAIIAEEMGFIIVVGLIVLLLLICYRGLRLAKNAPDSFGRLVAAGIIIWFVVQSFMNIGAMVGLMPLTGLPLPFISHGGTALFVSMAAVGILINISKYSESS